MSPAPSEAVSRAIEHETGKSIYELQEQTLSERRREVEEKHGTMTFTVNFPFIGRGNPLREKILSHAIIERRTVRALKRFDQFVRNSE